MQKRLKAYPKPESKKQIGKNITGLQTIKGVYCSEGFLIKMDKSFQCLSKIPIGSDIFGRNDIRTQLHIQNLFGKISQDSWIKEKQQN